MDVTYSNTLVASDDLALGRVGYGASWNGQPIVDVVQFFRAAGSTVYGRGDGPEEFALSVWRFFASEGAALAFCATHRAALPLQADLLINDSAATIALRMADAVRSVGIARRIGVAVLIEYRWVGTRFLSEDVSDPPDGEDTMKVGSVALAENDETKAVAFDTAFGAAPRYVDAVVTVPASGYVITAAVDESSITAAGFTARFGAAIPGSGYVLRWQAVL